MLDIDFIDLFMCKRLAPFKELSINKMGLFE